jgi:hypothetical protein
VVRLTREERRAESVKHDHGRMYRCKTVSLDGSLAYGEWFGTESDLRAAMGFLTRDLGKRYYCETAKISCPACEAGEEPTVISVL